MELSSTLGSGFILVGILKDSGSPELLCATVAVLYMLALVSNGLLVLVITVDVQLHVPMSLWHGQENTISFGGCALQMFLALILGGAEDLPLAFLAYDRYVAICHPLNYIIFMRPRVSSLSALGYTLYTIHYPFCMTHEIRHLLYEILPLDELMVHVTSVTFLILPLFVIVVSYTLILFTVPQMPSKDGRKKAFVTCSSYLTVVGIFYGAATLMCGLLSSFHSPKQDNITFTFHMIVTPSLNPLIYSLGNKEVMGALSTVLGK
uniref:G-protein coupled receptors family 1 profile domain-containing protein n=1 Tax=Chinchilla lanigera TaxID=34839 RepID=A0A8C2WAT4_CHILA